MLHRIGILVLLLMASRFSLAQAVNITHGPMLGHVTAESISIWARTSKPGQFHVRYGRMPDDLDQVSEPATTTADRDNTGWVRLKGLGPNTRYYYQPVTSQRQLELQDRFSRFPPRRLSRRSQRIRAGFSISGSNLDPAPINGRWEAPDPACRLMARCSNSFPGSIHFSIMNGDWLYEDKREFTVEDWREQTGSRNAALPEILELAPSIAGVWENYKYFLERGANLAAWHRVVPSYYTPDDHEILNDIFGTATVGRRDRRTVFRDIGIAGLVRLSGRVAASAVPSTGIFWQGKAHRGIGCARRSQRRFHQGRSQADFQPTRPLGWPIRGSGFGTLFCE